MGTRFKVIVVGDGAVGKPRAHITSSQNHGDVTFDMWDTAGQEKLSGLRHGYYVGAHAAIIMFDVSSRVTYKNVAAWYRDIDRICSSIPIVLCGNKVDVKDRAVKPRSIMFHRKKHIQYYDIAALANYNIEKPLLWLARTLISKNDLVQIPSPSVSVYDLL
ncbi:hypothetical protein LLEC1_02060 [Akanthomyces lecanii]|uniref:GTP-binding nuclear protein n=1 Tax=Cordyceps confragosa TaxID=2714763 RepID=A0A179IFQ2_CORDF|nr:hypothetical protein LLEC1_02060 [Akanthomyces lecanii]